MTPLKTEFPSAVSIKEDLEIQRVRATGQEGGSPLLPLEPHVYSGCGLGKQKDEENRRWGYPTITPKIKKVLFLAKGGQS